MVVVASENRVVYGKHLTVNEGASRDKYMGRPQAAPYIYRKV